VQSIKRDHPLCLTVPCARFGHVSRRASSQHDDGKAHTVLCCAHAQHRGDRVRRQLLLKDDFGKGGIALKSGSDGAGGGLDGHGRPQ